MDTIRRGFRTEMYLWGPDQPPVPVRWHRCHPDAQTFPEGHIWHSITWQQQGGHNERIGLLGPRGAYDKGKDHVGYRGVEYHGPLRCYQDHAIWGEDEQMLTGEDGSIGACRPTPNMDVATLHSPFSLTFNLPLLIPPNAEVGDVVLLVGFAPYDATDWNAIGDYSLLASGFDPTETIKWGVWYKLREEGDTDSIAYTQTPANVKYFYTFWIRKGGIPTVSVPEYGEGTTVTIPGIAVEDYGEGVSLLFAYHGAFGPATADPQFYQPVSNDGMDSTRSWAWIKNPIFGTVEDQSAEWTESDLWIGLSVRVPLEPS